MCVFQEKKQQKRLNKYRREDEEGVSVETKRESRVSETTGSLQSPRDTFLLFGFYFRPDDFISLPLQEKSLCFSG